MPLETTRFDASEYLDDPEIIAAYITEALETNDPAFIAGAIGDVARAYGMSKIAETAGVSRGSLYRGLSEAGNPELATVVSVLKAVGLGLAARPVRKPGKPTVKPQPKAKASTGRYARHSASGRLLEARAAAKSVAGRARK